MKQLEELLGYNLRLPHYSGAFMMTKEGDEFDDAHATFRIDSYQPDGLGGGIVNCTLVRGQCSEDIKLKNGTAQFCADSVAIFLLQTIERRAQEGRVEYQSRLKIQQERFIAIYLRGNRYKDASNLARKLGDETRAVLYESMHLDANK